MDKEKLSQKLNKLLSVSEERGATKDEAVVAALKVQQLLAKYNCELSDFDLSSEELEILTKDISFTDIGGGYIWARVLGVELAKNFGCQSYREGSKIYFIGHKTNLDILLPTYKFLYKVCNKLANEECKKYTQKYGHCKYVYKSFCEGFVVGVSNALAEQCVALQIVMPEDIQEEVKKLNLTTKTYNADSTILGAYSRGVEEGKEAAGRKKLNQNAE